jgi:hypothetical protein
MVSVFERVLQGNLIKAKTEIFNLSPGKIYIFDCATEPSYISSDV